MLSAKSSTVYKIKKEILKAENILIVSHRSPDADAVGSNLALRYFLEKQGKKVVSASIDPLEKNLLFLKDADKFVTQFNIDDFDLLISVDCSNKQVFAFNELYPEIDDKEIVFINIDHHESNDDFADINLVIRDACATAFVLFEVFKMLDWEIDRDMATALMAGIYFDTGSLKHSTNMKVFEACSSLSAKGANIKKIVKNLFKTIPVNTLRLWGRILDKASINEEGAVVSAVNQEDYRACSADKKDASGVIDYLNAVPNTKYCILLSETKDGVIRASMRTKRDDVNLSEFASKLGGGGHPKASGFGIPGKLKPMMKWQIEADDNEKNISF